ncbi:MAG TPA: hypothetical protein VN626_00660 [Clostridia bacterium]|nr:hypothetical protein [Clostridia bacterium]
MQKKEHDLEMVSKALKKLALRGAMAVYLVFLAWKIFSGMLNGSSPIPILGIWLICLVLASVAIGFCAFALMAYQKALKTAELSPAPESINYDSDSEIDVQ